jgi:hypothetical protein
MPPRDVVSEEQALFSTFVENRRGLLSQVEKPSCGKSSVQSGLRIGNDVVSSGASPLLHTYCVGTTWSLEEQALFSLMIPSFS